MRLTKKTSLFIGLLSVSQLALAADYSWLNTAPTDPYFDDALNWSTGIVPGTADNAIFGGADSDVWFQADATINYARFGDGEYSLDLNGYTWRVQAFADGLQVGLLNGDNSIVNVEDGDLITAAWSQVGLAAGSSGTVNVGAGAFLESFMTVGVAGTGNLNVTDGGRVQGSTITRQSMLSVAENAGSTGHVSVSGSGSEIKTYDSFAVPAGARFGIGDNTNSSLTVADSGYFQSNGLMLGEGLNASVAMTVSSGGQAVINNNLYVANGVGSTATVALDGSGTLLDVARSIEVGGAGATGQLDVTNGARLQSGQVNWYLTGADIASIGANDGSSGAVSVSGAGSEWSHTGDVWVGGGSVSPGQGSGELTISDGAVVKLFRGEEAGLPFAELIDAFIFVGSTSGTAAKVTIDNATLQLDSYDYNLRIGEYGQGEMVVRNGGRIEGGTGGVGSSNGSGTLTLTGAGSGWDADSGVYASNGGIINVLDGATLNSASGGASNGGQVNIDGVGSRWDMSRDFSVYGDLSITNGGVATGRIIGGYIGQSDWLIDGAGSQLVASAYISTGTTDAVFSNGAQVTSAGNFTVGGFGSGVRVSTVEVNSGASINAGGNVVLGDDAGVRLTLNDASVTAGNINITTAGTTLEVSGDGGATGVSSQITGNVFNSGLVDVNSSAIANFNSDFLNNTTVNIEAGSAAVFAGTLSGDGDFTGLGDAIVNGVLAPGNSPGFMSIAGDLEFGSASIFQAELAGEILGTEYDSVFVGGTATLDGTLEVLFIDGFAATPGDVFDLLVADTIVGQFDVALLPELGEEGWSWDLQYRLDVDGLDRLRLAAVPVPAAVWLFASALAGLGCFRRKQARVKSGVRPQNLSSI